MYLIKDGWAAILSSAIKHLCHNILRHAVHNASWFVVLLQL